MFKPNFGGTEIALLWCPELSEEAVDAIYDNVSATSVDTCGVYSQFSTLQIIEKMKSKQLTLPEEDDRLMRQIYDHYAYIEI